MWRHPSFCHHCDKFSAYNCDNCKILTIVKNCNICATARLFKCNQIGLWSMGTLRCFRMWTINLRAVLNRWLLMGLFTLFQAQAEFRSGHYFLENCCSAVALVQKQLKKQHGGSLLFLYPACWLSRKAFTERLFTDQFRQICVQQTDWTLFLGIEFTFWPSEREIDWRNHVIQWNEYIFTIFNKKFLWYEYLD